MKRKAIIFVITVAVGLGAYLLVLAILPDNYVPQEFIEARIKGAKIADGIVDLSNGSLASLSEIAKYNKTSNKKAALDLVLKETEKIQEAHDKALRLSSQLERMARTLNSIKPRAAQVLATEAVTSEVALVGRLLNYDNYMTQLFAVLQDELQNSTQKSEQVQELIDKINEETLAINTFNRRFNQSLAAFDEIIKN